MYSEGKPGSRAMLSLGRAQENETDPLLPEEQG